MNKNKIRISQLADLIGVNRKFLVLFVNSMGIKAKTTSSTIEKKQADRVNRILLKRNLIEEQSSYFEWDSSGLGELYIDFLALERKMGVQLVHDFLRRRREMPDGPQIDLSKMDQHEQLQILFTIAKNVPVTEFECILGVSNFCSLVQSPEVTLSLTTGLLHSRRFEQGLSFLTLQDSKLLLALPSFISRTDAQQILIQLLTYSVSARNESALRIFLSSTSLHLLDNRKGRNLLAACLQSRGHGWLGITLHKMMTNSNSPAIFPSDRILFWGVIDNVNSRQFHSADFLTLKISDPKLQLMAEFLSCDSQMDDVRSSRAFSRMIDLQCVDMNYVHDVAKRIAKKIGRDDLTDQLISSVEAWEKSLGKLSVAVATVLHQVAQKNKFTSLDVIEIVDPSFMPSEIDLDLQDFPFDK